MGDKDWRAEGARLRAGGMMWREITAELKKKYPGEDLGFNAVRGAIARYMRNPPPIAPAKSDGANTILLRMVEKGATAPEIANAIGVSEKAALFMLEERRDAGANLRETAGVWKVERDLIPTENRKKVPWNGERVIRFGMMGDTQINSKYTQLTHLHKLYDFYAAEGIKTVYHTGDLDDGEQMRKGHQYELYNQGVDDHKDEIVRVYPRREGITTEFIAGNHDYSMVKLAGTAIGRMVAAERPDMVYLGQDSALIQLADNCTLELRHPIDGSAYALSYKLQKMIDAMSSGEKPDVLAVGHYHKAEHMPGYRSVQAYQTGCLQAQTPWMRGKGFAAMMGGWLIEIYLNSDGGVDRVSDYFKPFEKAIKEDYKNWR